MAPLGLFESSCFLPLISRRSLRRIGARADPLDLYFGDSGHLAPSTPGRARSLREYLRECAALGLAWTGNHLQIAGLRDSTRQRIAGTIAAAAACTASRQLPLLPLPPHGPVLPNRH